MRQIPDSAPVRIGILHSLTGTMALSEMPLRDAALLAIAEINAAGGVLGRLIEPVIADGASDPATFAVEVRAMIEQAQVATVFGCWTSASRKAVLAEVEEHNILLWYPLQYEGLECSRNIFYTGCCPNQQVETAVNWLLQNQGNRFYLLGSDYIYPLTVNKLISAQLKQQGGIVVGEDYVTLGTQSFADTIHRIRQLKPDVVFNTLNGDSNVAFYRQYRAAGMRAEDIPILGVSVAEVELQQMGDLATGHYACWTYFQSLDTAANHTFVQNFRARYGQNRVTSDPIATAYSQIYLWKQAVELAESFETDRVRTAAYGQTFAAPGGLMQIEPNHHVQKQCRIGKTLPDGQFQIVHTTDPIKPLPWLGVEETNSDRSAVVIDLLSEVSQWIQKAQQLEQKSNQLEVAMAQLQREMQERERGEAERQRAEAALKASEAELRSFFAAMPDLTFVYNNEGRILKVLAPTSSDLFVAPPETLVGKTLHEVLPSAIADLEVYYTRQCLATQQVISNIEYNLVIDGKDIWASATVSPLSENTAIWVARDASDRKRTEAALQKSEQRNRAILEAVPDLMFCLNRDGIRLERIGTNFSIDLVPQDYDPVGQHVSDYLSPEHAQRQLHFLHQVLSTGQPQYYEQQVLLNGKMQYEEVRVVPSGPAEALFMIRDISDRKRAEAALQASEAELRALFAAMNDIVAVFDHQGICLRIAATDPNDLFSPADEQIGRTVHENLPKAVADIHLESIQHALKTQQTISIEYSLLMEEQENWFSAKVSPLSESSALMVSRDITNLKRAEKAVRASEAELRSFFAAMPDITMVFNQEGRCLKILAPLHDDFFAVPPIEQIGRTVDESLPPAEAALQLRFIRQCIETQQVIRNIEYNLPIGSRETWFSATVSPLPENTVLWIARDISDRKQAEADLQEGLHQLALANQEIVSLNQQLASENLRMGAELSVTRQLQQMILPTDQELSKVEGLEISGFMEPAAEVGGDYYDVQTHNGLVKIGIGDVMGHGLESGMLMLMVQTAVKTLLINQETDATQFLSTLNQVIYENARRMNSDRNITLALLDYEQGQLKVSGQHEQVLIVRANGKIERIDTVDLGFPLGLVPDIAAFVAQTSVQLAPGDGVVLYTDGVTEAENLTRELYGLEQLCQVISQHWQKSVPEIRQAVVEDVYRHIGKQKIYDDITLLVLKQQ